MYDKWIVIFGLIMPALTVVCFGMMVCRLWVIYQKERSTHTVFRALVSFGLTAIFLLYSLNARKAPLIPTHIFLGLTTAFYVVLGIALAVSSWYEWRILLAFLRQKNTEFVSAHAPEVMPTKALAEVAAEGSTLVATKETPQ